MRKRLFLLFVVEAAACVAATGTVGRLNLRIADVGVAVLVAGVALLVLQSLPERAAQPVGTGVAAAARHSTTKKLLLLLMLMGLIGYVGARFTWAGFTAETDNPNGSISSGTLIMTDLVNSQTLCGSTTALSADNYNAACDAVLAPTNMEPGSFTALGSTVPPTGPNPAGSSSFFSKLTIQNTGSLDASLFSVYGLYVNARLASPITVTNGVPLSNTSITISALEGTVQSGDQIQLNSGPSSQTFSAHAAASGGATQLFLDGTPTATVTFGANTRVLDLSSDTTTSNADCYDVNTSGNAYNFNSPSGNPLCGKALIWIQEQTGGNNYCWFGHAASTQAGACRTPTTMTLGTTISSGATISSLNVGTLTGNVQAGDQVVLKENGVSNTCTVGASNYYLGSTSTTISITSCSVPSAAQTTYDSSAVVYDSSAYGDLNPTAANSSFTLTSLDTSHGQNHPIYLPPLNGQGTANTNATVQLTSSATRIFYVGVYFPAPTGAGQNNLQGLKSTFGIGWHIDQ